MATKQLKAMTKSTEDSTRVYPCRKNICSVQESRLMILALNQRTLSVMGRKKIVMPMSVVENIERK